MTDPQQATHVVDDIPTLIDPTHADPEALRGAMPAAIRLAEAAKEGARRSAVADFGATP